MLAFLTRTMMRPLLLLVLLGTGCGGNSTTVDCPDGAPYDLHAAERAAPSCAFTAGDTTSKTIGACAPHGQALAGKIDHILVLMQENRSFDHYFSHLPAYGQPDVDVATDADSNPQGTFDSATGTCTLRAGTAARYHETRFCISDTNHEWMEVHAQYNGGLMDGFLCTNNPGGERAMGYYTEVDLPYYYWLASTFSLSDRYFSSLLGPTAPNRFFLYSATAWNITVTNTRELPPRPDAQMRNIWYQLQNAGRSFKIYRDGSYAASLYYGYFGEPFANFQADVAAGALPDVSFLDPRWSIDSMPETSGEDEHPPANVQLGQQFIKRVIDTLASNPAVWQRSVLFITYDEHGGFYDHVVPPPACPPDGLEPPGPPRYPIQYHHDRYGIRVPLLVVSPYAKAHFVSHTIADHTSILRFIENRFDLPAMTRRDANAWPLLDLFDFDHPPFVQFPPNAPAAQLTPSGMADCAAHPTGSTGAP